MICQSLMFTIKYKQDSPFFKLLCNWDLNDLQESELAQDNAVDGLGGLVSNVNRTNYEIQVVGDLVRKLQFDCNCQYRRRGMRQAILYNKVYRNTSRVL